MQIITYTLTLLSYNHDILFTQVFVDKPPLLKAAVYSIITVTAVLFGIVTFIIYLNHSKFIVIT